MGHIHGSIRRKPEFDVLVLCAYVHLWVARLKVYSRRTPAVSTYGAGNARQLTASHSYLK